jgi:hypothetical protein
MTIKKHVTISNKSILSHVHFLFATLNCTTMSIKQTYISDIYQDKNKNQTSVGYLFENKVFYIECGMEMPFFLSTEENGPRKKIAQVTIRDIKINKKYQKQKLFTNFIKWLLLEKKIAVQLESIQPDWLKEKLETSDLWVLQTPVEYKQYNPSYARFIGIATNEKDFRLF